MESILKSIKKKKIPINPAVVISNKPNAKGLKIARKLGINIEIIESKGFKGSRWQYDKKIIAALIKHGVTPRNGLVDVVVQSEAEQVYTIHGFVDEFAEHLKKIGITAQPLLENSLDDFT